MDSKLNGTERIWLAIFILYIAVILKLTIFRDISYDVSQLNLMLFIDLIRIYKNEGIWEFLRLFLGNIGWFVPLGFLLPMFLNKKSIARIAMCGLGFSFVIEVLQFIFRKGVTEIDDLILNTLGATIGYLIYKIFASISTKQ